MLALLWEYINDIISHTLPHVHHLSQHIFGISYRWLKNVKISMEVSLLEKQNWYYGDHLEKIPMIYWEGSWTGRDFKITISLISLMNSFTYQVFQDSLGVRGGESKLIEAWFLRFSPTSKAKFMAWRLGRF